MPDAPSPELAFELAQAYWPDVEHDPRQLLVVPVGSLEQHGPHLPLDTDTRIAVAVARRACQGRAGVALAPALPVGASGEHAAFPGTLSIGSEALASCLIELGRHASLHWPALLLVNGHGGNVTAVEAAVGRLRYEGRACLAWHAALPEGDAHAVGSHGLNLHLDEVAVLAFVDGELIEHRRRHRIGQILRELLECLVRLHGVLDHEAELRFGELSR